MAAGAAQSKPLASDPKRTERGARRRGLWQAGAMELPTAHAAAEHIAPLLAGGEERLIAAHLDARQRLVAVTRAEGRIDAVDLSIRAIIGDALASGAAGIILAHNHPSGDPTPSEADRAATRRLAEVAAPLGLRLHDHLIFGGGRVSSFRALGWL